jgi:adenylate cyclase
MADATKKLTQSTRRVAEKLASGSVRVQITIALLVTLAGLYVYYGTITSGVTDEGTKLPGAAVFGFVQNMELKSLDTLFKSRGPRSADPRIVVVDIDEKTLRKVGAWPIPRDAYAKLIDKLHEGGTKVVAFDVSFPTPEKNSAVEALKKLETEVGNSDPRLVEKIRAIEATSNNDKILAESMKRAGNVVIGHSFLDPDLAATIPLQQQEDYYNILWGQPFSQVRRVGGGEFNITEAFGKARGRITTGVFPNIGLIADAAKSYGFYDALVDNDGTVRNTVLLLWYKDLDFFTPLAVHAVTEYENIDIQNQQAFIAVNGVDRIELGRHNIRVARDGTALVNFVGPYRSYLHYSLADVIDGSVPASTFKDKMVFVGATAKGIGDMRSTPFQIQDQGYMGVEINANIADNILHSDEPNRTFIHRGYYQQWTDIGFILFFGLFMSWVFGTQKPLVGTAAMVIALSVFLAAAGYVFARFGTWLYVIVPITTLVLDYGALTSYRMVFEEREKRKVRKTFERYVPPGVISLIEKDPAKYFKPGGEMREMTIMFSDIRSFTTICEGMTADDLVLLLNEYLGAMTEVLFENWGTLDKYIGDALMAFWGSPYPQEDHAVRGCACALGMSKRLEELNRTWEAQGRKRLEIGIGVNTGPVNVGNMGCDIRFSWTVMGDHVNLASRLEGQNKAYHTARIVSEFTYAEAQEYFLFRPLDRIRVKGKLKPVYIYELLGYPEERAAYEDLLSRWAVAQEAYFRQSWDEAARHFEDLLTRYPDDGPSHTFLKRCHEYRVHAPEAGWDGVYIAKEK